MADSTPGLLKNSEVLAASFGSFATPGTESTRVCASWSANQGRPFCEDPLTIVSRIRKVGVLALEILEL